MNNYPGVCSRTLATRGSHTFPTQITLMPPRSLWSRSGGLQRNEPGDREKATSLLDESLAISSELGMRPLAERVLSRREHLKA